MKQKVLMTLIAIAMVAGQPASAGSISDSYATGDTLTAAKMNNIKTAVNDNNDNIDVNAQNIDTNTTNIEDISNRVKVFETGVPELARQVNELGNDLGKLADEVRFNVFELPLRSYVRFQVPVMSSSAQNTRIRILLANESKTSCDIAVNTLTFPFKVGANFQILYLTPPNTPVTLPGVSGGQTTTIVDYVAMDRRVDGYDYVNVFTRRDTSDSADTCGSTTVTVRGAIADYPDGSRYFVPVKSMGIMQ